MRLHTLPNCQRSPEPPGLSPRLPRFSRLSPSLGRGSDARFRDRHLPRFPANLSPSPLAASVLHTARCVEDVRYTIRRLHTVNPARDIFLIGNHLMRMIAVSTSPRPVDPLVFSGVKPACVSSRSIVMEERGFEPLTPCLQSRCSTS